MTIESEHIPKTITLTIKLDAIDIKELSMSIYETIKEKLIFIDNRTEVVLEFLRDIQSQLKD